MHVNKQKILIADDSEINRALLIEILENQYDIVEAENGVEAIALLSRYKRNFHSITGYHDAENGWFRSFGFYKKEAGMPALRLL